MSEHPQTEEKQTREREDRIQELAILIEFNPWLATPGDYAKLVRER